MNKGLRGVIQSTSYWSSTTLTSSPSNAWGVHFSSGVISTYGKDGLHSFIAVRGESGIATPNPVVRQTPVQARPNANFTHWGEGFSPNSTATLYFFTYPDRDPIDTRSVVIQSDGTFSAPFNPPSSEVGEYLWYAIDDATGRRSNDQTYKLTEGPVPNIGAQPLNGPQGTTFALFGDGFTSNGIAQITVLRPDGGILEEQELTVSETGGIAYDLPIFENAPIGEYTWWAVDQTTGVRAVEFRFTVAEGGGANLTPPTLATPADQEEITASTFRFGCGSI